MHHDALALLCLLLVGILMRAERTHSRTVTRALRIARTYRKRRDVLADQCAALIEEAKSVNETACELMIELDAYKREEAAREKRSHMRLLKGLN